MSSSQRSYQSYSSGGSGGSFSYTSTSSVSYSDASGTREQHTYSDPSGTTVTTSNKPIGGEATHEKREYPASGRGIGGGQSFDRRIEDVSDTPAQAEENIEPEVEEPREKQ